jgi:sodium/potassium-transporting ATPase subunit alpha
VQRYQRGGHCVVALGDGTNDAPALKMANVSVSMGSLRASDVAKEAADVVILDDDFAHIVDLIAHGRLVYANIRKTMAFVLAHGIPELVPVFCIFVFDLPVILTGTLILVVDLLTEQLPAISLAYEPAESLFMRVPPRDRALEHLVDGRLIVYSFGFIALLETLTCVGVFFLAMSQRGYPIASLLYERAFWLNPPPAAAAALAEGVSAYFFSLVVCQACVHVYLCKTSRASIFVHNICANWLTVVGSVVGIAIATLCIYPLQGAFFASGGMPQATSWVLVFGFAAVALPITEAVKACARAAPRGFVDRMVAW